jgi:hypothetical protein
LGDRQQIITQGDGDFPGQGDSMDRVKGKFHDGWG